ncbi:nucleic acid/nucleotide deaminase domain-containing protein [Streptomyces cyaneogriseus]|uniref:WXG100-like domain-containing protein n=1 Tax=Streptomyces cyaneogriseus TaxID=68192 RepID=UPI0007C6F6DC|nr:nucleic acid/nucleotide deaminase domain-containing protein [Streptomyces cyaneogriseus]
MGVTLPSYLDEALDLIGVSWPNIDEDDYREMAQAMREFADDIDDGAAEAHKAVTELIGANEGLAIQALEKHWGKVKDTHLQNLAEAGRMAATALDGVAVLIEGAKLAAIAQLGILAAEIAAAVAASPVTLGLSALGGLAATQATRIAVKKIFQEVCERVAEEVVNVAMGPVYQALGSMTGDLVVQLGGNALGVQDGVDLGRTAQAGRAGLTQGVDAAQSSMRLNSSGGDGVDSGQFSHDPDSFDRADSGLKDAGGKVRDKAGGKLSRAKSAHGRTKGRDPIGNAANPVIETVLDGIEEAAKTAAKHLDDNMTRGMKTMSRNYRDSDGRTARDLEGLHRAHSLGDLAKYGDKTPVYLLNKSGKVSLLQADGKKVEVDPATLDPKKDSALIRLLSDGNPMPESRREAVPLGRDKASTEGPRKNSTPVAAGTTELSRATQLARHSDGYYAGKNYAAFRVGEGENSFILVGRVDGPHSERIVGVPLKNSGMVDLVTDAYSERAPCRTPQYFCGEWMEKYFPNTKMSHSFEYGELATWQEEEDRTGALQESQRRGNREMAKYVGSLSRLAP